MRCEFLIILIIIQLSLADEGSKTCYACASPSLRSRWYLTGLPSVADAYFTSCDDTQSIAGTEPCSGACFTLLFDDPDTITNGGSTQPSSLVVRGCHSSLVQVASDRTSNTGSFCEYDTNHMAANSKGNTVAIRMLMEFCSSSQCNNRPAQNGYNQSPVCSQQTVNNFLNGKPLNCYECVPQPGKNCRESKCTKKYCLKQETKIQGGFQLMKTCSNVNIYGLDNYCMTSTVITNPGGMAVKNRYTQCYCKDKQFCNSTPTFKVITVIIVSLVKILLL